MYVFGLNESRFAFLHPPCCVFICVHLRSCASYTYGCIPLLQKLVCIVYMMLCCCWCCEQAQISFERNSSIETMDSGRNLDVKILYVSYLCVRRSLLMEFLTSRKKQARSIFRCIESSIQVWFTTIRIQAMIFDCGNVSMLPYGQYCCCFCYYY